MSTNKIKEENQKFFKYAKRKAESTKAMHYLAKAVPSAVLQTSIDIRNANYEEDNPLSMDGRINFKEPLYNQWLPENFDQKNQSLLHSLKKRYEDALKSKQNNSNRTDKVMNYNLNVIAKTKEVVDYTF